MNEKCKACGSCGVPLEKAEDYALGDPSQEYCCYCTDEKGGLLPYSEILEMNTKYYIESQGITEQAAQTMAANFLKSQPAWKNV